MSLGFVEITKGVLVPTVAASNPDCWPTKHRPKELVFRSTDFAWYSRQQGRERFAISWAAVGIGFGSATFARVCPRGPWVCVDDEAMSTEFIRFMLEHFVETWTGFSRKSKNRRWCKRRPNVVWWVEEILS